MDDRGKAEVARSGLVPPLLDAGFAVLSVDLRGRGELLGHYSPTWDTNFRIVANQKSVRAAARRTSSLRSHSARSTTSVSVRMLAPAMSPLSELAMMPCQSCSPPQPIRVSDALLWPGSFVAGYR